MSTLPFPGPGEESPRPRRFGRYEILDRLGHGSMGVVYLARDPLIGRRVALKALADGKPLKPEEVERLRSRLLNEAASAGQLNHPGIVTIHDVVDDAASGQVCIAMEYVAGRTLKEYLQKRDILSLQFTAEVIGQVAEVLDFAHSHGVVHRDIKPANVMLAEDGLIKITDFGIASLRGQDLAQDLRSMGTPNYLAPERLLGFEADHRADVYSLGVLVYEMLTGHVPFQGESLAELARNTVEQDFTPPEIYRPDLLPGLRAILDRALSKEPDERYQSAGDLASDLQAVVKAQSRMSDTRPVEEVLIEGRAARPEASPGFTARLLAGATAAPRRAATALAAAFRGPFSVRPGRVAIWASVGVVFLAGIGAAVWLTSRPQPAEAVVTVESRSAAEAQDEIRRLRYIKLLGDIEKLYQEGRSEEAEALLAEAGQLAPEPERIERLREEAHFNVEADRAVRQVAQVLQLLAAASEAIDRGSLATAEAALFKVRELDPENEEATGLEQRLAAARQAIVVAQRRHAEELAAAAVEEAPRFEPFTVTEPPPPPPVNPFGTLKIDFQSEVPRGVVTVYQGSEQILRREFSFFERRSLFRRKATAGGFEETRRIAAGDVSLRVYLSIPGNDTLSSSIEGPLPGGGVRILTIRVDAEGQLVLGYR
jgi:serine/threonine-protein kinase